MVDSFEKIRNRLMANFPPQTEFVPEAMDVIPQTMITPEGVEVSPATTQRSSRELSNSSVPVRLSLALQIFKVVNPIKQMC